MGQALAQVLPIAIAVALSSVPIMATVMILLSPRGRASALPFLLGWLIGLATVVTAATVGAAALPRPGVRQPDLYLAWAQIAVGTLLAGLAAVRWYRAIRMPRPTSMPKWLLGVQSMGPLPALGLSLALNLRPKALLLAIAAGLGVHAADAGVPSSAIVLAIYVAISGSTVAVPIIASLIAPARMAPTLIAIRSWLTRNSTTVTNVIVLVLGVFIAGNGISRL